MRKLYTLIAWSLLAASCSKSGTPDNGCIERDQIKLTDPGLPPSKMVITDNLFASNNIDHRNLRYYQYDTDSLNNNFEQIIRLDQYANGRRIINGQMVYVFQNGIFNYQGGTPTHGTSLDTIPHLSLPTLRRLFTNDIRHNPQMTTTGITDSCYKAEFGYYNLGINTPTEDLIKAWIVTVTISQYPWYYPAAVYRDDNGKRVYYSGNIVYMNTSNIIN